MSSLAVGQLITGQSKSWIGASSGTKELAFKTDIPDYSGSSSKHYKIVFTGRLSTRDELSIPEGCDYVEIISWPIVRAGVHYWGSETSTRVYKGCGACVYVGRSNLTSDVPRYVTLNSSGTAISVSNGETLDDDVVVVAYRATDAPEFNELCYSATLRDRAENVSIPVECDYLIITDVPSHSGTDFYIAFNAHTVIYKSCNSLACLRVANAGFGRYVISLDDKGRNLKIYSLSDYIIGATLLAYRVLS